MNQLLCETCLTDETIPNVRLNKKNSCQFCVMHDEMEKEYPLNELSSSKLGQIAIKIKEQSLNKRYNCVVGVSGGRDSTYLLYVVKKIMKLNPLAVHYDNGFDSKVSVTNILNICEKLDVDLETVVEDWNSFKKITKSFFLAGVSDPDTPTDVGIFKSMYEIAYREKIKFVFNGHSFRTEGIEPLDWTYIDGLYIKSICKLHGSLNFLEKFNNFSLTDLFKYKFLRRIKTILPLNYLEYDHAKVEKILENEVGWKYYGGHHHESLLTKFIVSIYLPKKFNIDRRKTGLSAMVRSNKISKNEALKIISTPPKLTDEKELTDYILSKLEISKEEYLNILQNENKNFRNYTTYHTFLKYFKPIAKVFYQLNLIPKLLYLRYYG